MKPFRKALRLWFVIASVFSFLGGWVLLAHSPKPVQVTSARSSALANLPPIQAFGSNVNNNGLGFFSNVAPATAQQNSGFPLLMTGGS
ncbi:MAG TPA: hypothetical protein VMC09_09525 [Anaerolineales bacterium]|nr:hypothetical protein [Anaerolineales bacterium]